MMHLFRLLVFVFITNVAASTCPDFDTDEGNFHRTCDTESFAYRSGMGITDDCLRADLKTNISTILGLSKCLGYNTKTNKLEWKIPPSCNATMTDERGWNNTQGQGDLGELLDHCLTIGARCEPWSYNNTSFERFFLCNRGDQKPSDWSVYASINLAEHIYNNDGRLGCFGEFGP